MPKIIMTEQIESLCEKVLPYEVDRKGREIGQAITDGNRRSLADALTSGLLCDGKELAEKEHQRAIKEEAVHHLEKILDEKQEELEELRKDKDAILETLMPSGKSKGEFELLRYISDLKLKLSEAAKELEKAQTFKGVNWTKLSTSAVCSQNKNVDKFIKDLETKLSGSCEPLSVDEIKSVLLRKEKRKRHFKSVEAHVDYLAKAIHTQMTRGVGKDKEIS